VRPGVTHILIVDDHAVVRHGVRLLLEQEPDLVVCAEAERASEALTAAERHDPDVALVDIALPGTNGLDLIRALRRERPRTAIVVLSMHDEAVYAERALRAGARGYVTKRRGPDDVVAAVRTVVAGRIHLPEATASAILARLAGVPSDEGSSLDRLTDRELEVFQLIGRGCTTREIAGRLSLSIKTIESHREHIKQKLGLDNAAALVHCAVTAEQQRAV
jgi:DNA-binding NarL/FixJ family response regulator